LEIDEGDGIREELCCEVFNRILSQESVVGFRYYCALIGIFEEALLNM